VQSDEEQLRELVATWMAASRSGDVATVLSFMTDDAVFLVPGQQPMRKADFAAVAQAQAGAGAPTIDATNEIQEIRILGDWAYLWQKLTVVMTPPHGVQSITRTGHTLTIYHKQNGRWLLARDANMLAVASDNER
jgi:uncharacterized protein (TIGR02246 family)